MVPVSARSASSLTHRRYALLWRFSFQDLVWDTPQVEKFRSCIPRIGLKNFKSLQRTWILKNWQAMAHSGRKFRIGPNARLSESPEPHEFPLLLEPVTHEQLLEELEELQLQEELLREQLQLVELEKALNDEQQKLVAEAIQQAPKGCPLVVDFKITIFGGGTIKYMVFAFVRLQSYPL